MDMIENMFKPEFKFVRLNILSLMPSGRVGLGDDMKVLAVFLAAKASDYNRCDYSGR